jgi:phosphoribosyl 1,2-cyclic phosphodiesterase
MELIILGSSSRGNGYILSNDSEALVIECGQPLLEVKKELDFNVNKVVGAIVSHEHGDHSKYVNDFLNNRINVYMSPGTDKALKTTAKYLPLLVKSGERKKLGNFTVLAFDVKHDCNEPLGFLIHHPEMGNMLFATDTYYLPYNFDGLTNILIECNYREDILQANIEKGNLPKALRNRTLQSHMSFATCKEALLANDLSKVNNIVLIHLSDGNSNADEFKRDIHAATGKTVHIAERGLRIPFNKTPF